MAMPEMSAAAADRHDHDYRRRQIFGDLKADSSLPGDDQFVVKGVNISEPAFLFKLARICNGLVKARAVHDDLGTLSLCRLHLCQRRAFGKHDRRLDVVQPCRKSDRLGVISG